MLEKDDEFLPAEPIEKKNLQMLTAFVLANCLQMMYMLVQVCTKTVLTRQDNISSFELTFFRSLYNFIASSIFLVIAKDSLTANIDKSNMMILATRCVSGSITFLCFVVAIEYLPLSIFFVMMNATPFFIALLACVWLKEKITLVEVFTMLGAFGGIILVGLSKTSASSDVKQDISQEEAQT